MEIKVKQNSRISLKNSICGKRTAFGDHVNNFCHIWNANADVSVHCRMETQDDPIILPEGGAPEPEMGAPPLNLMCSLYYEATFDESFRLAAEADPPQTIIRP